MNALTKLLTLSALTVACLLLVGNAGVQAADLADTKCYVDLDGDGLDDNAIDFRDGFLLDDEESETTDSGAQVVNPFAQLAADNPVDLPQTHKERFVGHRFSARALSSYRSDFESDFGGGGAGGSSSGGKTCVGGVCF